MNMEDDAVEGDEAETTDAAEEIVEGEAQAEEADTSAEAVEEALIVQIGDDEPEQQEENVPEWVKDIRRANREKDKRIKELEREAGLRDQKTPLAAKPTLEGCDYDQAEFERQLETWFDAKRQADDAEKTKRDEQERADQAWQGKLKRYADGKASLKVADYDDVEATVLETFSVTQQGIVVQGAKNPALLAYALGKNPTRAKALAAITDPIEFAFAVAEVELSLKVTSKTTPAPEGKIQSTTAGISASVDGTLERLRKDAEKTGDYSKVVAYKKERRA